MGLATLSSKTVASEMESERDTPREDRNRANTYRCESIGVSIEMSQGSLSVHCVLHAISQPTLCECILDIHMEIIRR